MNVAAIILAAGSSARFQGGHKLVAEVAGVPLVRRVALVLAQSELGDIVLVTAADTPGIAKAAGHGRWRTVENANPDDGLSSSLRLGIQSTDRNADGILVALADMPGITAPLVNTLLHAFEESDGRAIVFPETGGRQGHPVIWPRSLIAELEGLSGDAGGKSVLAQHPQRWRPVPFEDAGAYADIDTRADLDAFRRHILSD